MHECWHKSCAKRLHTSLGELLDHIQNSHLSRIQLPCPINGMLSTKDLCRQLSTLHHTGCSTTFTLTRALQFDEHLKDNHPDFYDSTTRQINVPSPSLKPGCMPVRCSHPIPGTPEIPTGKYLICDILPLRIRPRPSHVPLSTDTSRQAAALFQWGEWGYIDNLRVEEETEKAKGGFVPVVPLHLTQLPRHLLNDIPPTSLALRRKPPDAKIDAVQQLLSRPVLIPAVPLVIERPPTTIGFKVVAIALERERDAAEATRRQTGKRRRKGSGSTDDGSSSSRSKRATRRS